MSPVRTLLINYRVAKKKVLLNMISNKAKLVGGVMSPVRTLLINYRVAKKKVLLNMISNKAKLVGGF